MSKFNFCNTHISDLIYINSFSTDDERGFFSKYFEKEVFYNNGIELDIHECFESHSQKGVIRGMHFQTEEPQAKLIYVNYGRIFDVAIDLRRNSKTYGKWEGVYLSSDERNALYIPKGFAHGFLAVEDSIVTYACEGRYVQNADSGIVWSDKDICIKWPLPDGIKIIVSSKDQNLQSFKEYNSNFGGF